MFKALTLSLFALLLTACIIVIEEPKPVEDVYLDDFDEWRYDSLEEMCFEDGSCKELPECYVVDYHEPCYISEDNTFKGIWI